MKRLLTLLLIISTSVMASAHWHKGIKGSGRVIEEKRVIKDFDRLEVSTGINLHITQNNKTTVKVVTDDNIMKYLETEKDGNTLKIRCTKSIKRSTKFDVYVSLPELKSIKASSAADVDMVGTFKSDEVRISASSAADVDVNFDSMTIKASASSAADIDLAGRTTYFEGSVSSAGEVNARSLESREAEVKASSAGSLSVTVTESIEARASSGASINYYGSPKQRDVSSSSGGSVSGR